MKQSSTLKGVDKLVRGPSASLVQVGSLPPAVPGRQRRKRRPDVCLTGPRQGPAPETEGNSLMIFILTLFLCFISRTQNNRTKVIIKKKQCGRALSSQHHTPGSGGWGGACVLSWVPFPHSRRQIGITHLIYGT